LGARWSWPEHRGERFLAEIVPLGIGQKRADDANAEADRPAIDRVADDPRAARWLIAGEIAVDGPDDRQVLKRVDDIEQVFEPETARRPKGRAGSRRRRGGRGGKGRGEDGCVGHGEPYQ